MKRPQFYVVLLLILAGNSVIGQTKVGEATIADPALRSSRGRVLQWTSNAGKPFWYRVPKTIPKKGATLLLMLHGLGSQHPWAFEAYANKPFFRKDNIIVAPEGMSPGRGQTFVFAENQNDENQLVGLIKKFATLYKVKAVFVYGHSRGGFFVYWFAGRQAELIDGFVSHAGGPNSRVVHSDHARKNLGVAIIHGRADPKVSVNQAIRGEKLYREAGYEKIKLEIVDGLTAKNGHGRLPKEVNQILAWLDGVTKPSVSTALSAFDSELEKVAPSASNLFYLHNKTLELLSADKVKNRPQVEMRLATQSKHLELLVQRSLQVVSAKPFNPEAKEDHLGAALLRRCAKLFQDHAGWKKSQKPAVLNRILKDSKRVTKSFKSVCAKWREPSRVQAEKTVAVSFLGRHYSDLVAALGEAIKKDPMGLKQKAQSRLRAQIETTLKLEREVDEILSGLCSELTQEKGD